MFHQKTDETCTAIPLNMEQIVDKYGNSLFRMCYLYLKDIQLAEDAVQDTFVKVYRNYNQFQGGSNEKTWIMRIAINVCKDYLRSTWIKRVTPVETFADVLEPAKPIAEDNLLIAEVMKLKPKYREILLLYYYQDMKINEISHILQTPESTISVRLKRAREQLKKNLKGWDFD